MYLSFKECGRIAGKGELDEAPAERESFLRLTDIFKPGSVIALNTTYTSTLRSDEDTHNSNHRGRICSFVGGIPELKCEFLWCRMVWR